MRIHSLRALLCWGSAVARCSDTHWTHTALKQRLKQRRVTHHSYPLVACLVVGQLPEARLIVARIHLNGLRGGGWQWEMGHELVLGFPLACFAICRHLLAANS